MIYYLRKKRLSTSVNLLSISRYFFCLVYLDCEPCSHVSLQIITIVLEQYVQGIETDSPGIERRSALAIGSVRLGLQQLSGSKTVLQAGWKLSCRKEVTSVREQAKEKSSAEKGGKYCSPGCSGSSRAMLPRLCIANGRFSARLQGRRMRGLCALSL